MGSIISTKHSHDRSLSFQDEMSPNELKDYRAPWEKQMKNTDTSSTLKKSESLPSCSCIMLFLCSRVPSRNRRKVSCDASPEAQAEVMIQQMPDLPESRINKWFANFDALLRDEVGVIMFGIFLQEEVSGENLNFWLAA